MDIEFSPETIDAQLDVLRHLANGTLDSAEVHDVLKRLNQQKALLVFLQNRKGDLIKVIAKWIEERWGKGSVDDASLLPSLESVFGRIERIEEKSSKIGPSTYSPTIVTAGDWKHRPDLGKGVFELKGDPAKRIDVSLPGPDVLVQPESDSWVRN
jgi:hypothetical protein